MGQYFRLDGLSGFFIAVALLLSILAFLTVNAISVQSSTAKNHYKIENAQDIKMISDKNAQHVVVQVSK